MAPPFEWNVEIDGFVVAVVVGVVAAGFLGNTLTVTRAVLVRRLRSFHLKGSAVKTQLGDSRHFHRATLLQSAVHAVIIPSVYAPACPPVRPSATLVDDVEVAKDIA